MRRDWRPGSLPPRIGLIDLGSRWAQLCVVERRRGDPRRLRVIEELALPAPLATTDDRPPADNAVWRTLASLRWFARRLDALGVPPQACRAVATAATRRGASSLLDSASTVLGLPVEQLSGREEAELVALAQRRSFPQHLPLLAVDLGGGSTELALRDEDHTSWALSLPLGTAALAGACGDDVSALRERCATEAASLPPARNHRVAVITGGTATAATQVLLGEPLWDPQRIHGQRVTRPALAALVDRLAPLASDAREALPGLTSRGATILPGLLWLDALLARYDEPEALVSTRDLWAGLLFRDWPRSTLS